MIHDGLLRRVRGQDQSTGSGPVRATVWRLRRNLGEDASTHTVAREGPGAEEAYAVRWAGNEGEGCRNRELGVNGPVVVDASLAVK